MLSVRHFDQKQPDRGMLSSIDRTRAVAEGAGLSRGTRFALLAARSIAISSWDGRSAQAVNDINATESIAIVGNISNSTINNTISKQDPAILASMAKVFANEIGGTAQAKARAEMHAEELARQLNTTTSAVISFFRLLGQQDVTPEQLPQKLAEIATQYKQTFERLAALEPQDPATKAIVEQATSALRESKFDEANQLLAQAEETELLAAKQASRLAEDARSAANERLLRAAADRGTRGNIALIRLHYADAVELFSSAADLVPPGNPRYIGSYRQAQAEALASLGQSRGDLATLKQALATLQLAVDQFNRTEFPREWARAQARKGYLLTEIYFFGDPEGRVDESIAAYQAALAEIKGEGDPVLWASVHTKLSRSLLALPKSPEKASKLRGELGDLKQALEIVDSERPELSSTLKAMIGNTYSGLGQLEGREDELEEAVANLRAAVAMADPERDPLNWGANQHNLGLALLALGRKQPGKMLFEQAVEAFRSALARGRRDDVPAEWALTEGALGDALWALSSRLLKHAEPTEAHERMTEAADCYQKAKAAYAQMGVSRKVEDYDKNWNILKSELERPPRILSDEVPWQV
jgi:tetratricopeptide (TPR) repeat protein